MDMLGNACRRSGCALTLMRRIICTMIAARYELYFISLLMRKIVFSCYLIFEVSDVAVAVYNITCPI